VLLAAYTGLRRGEVLGLRWQVSTSPKAPYVWLKL
jgi:integrase